MKSKTSFFSKTLFFKNLKRYWPLWVILTIFALLVPVYVGLQIGKEYLYDSEVLALVVKSLYYDFIKSASPVVAMIVASMAAICVWNYLYNPKSAGGMHSYPLSRKTLFVTNYLSGLAMMLIPYVFGGSALVILLAVKGAGVPACTWTLILSILCTTVFYFSFATLIAHVTSHIIALPVLYVMFMALEPIVVSLVGVIAGGFLYGLNFDYWHKLDFLCPIYYMIDRVQNVVDYSVKYETPNGYANIFECTLTGFNIQVIYALVGLAITIGAYFIYKKRKNETAGDVLAVKSLKPVIVAILTFIATACGTLILYIIFIDESDDFVLVPFLLCMLVAVTISYYVSVMVVEKKVNVFNKRTNIGFAIALAAGIVLSVSMSVDLFNIEKYIPDNSKFDTVQVNIYSNTYYFETGKDDKAIEEVKKLHKVLCESEGELENSYIGGFPDNTRSVIHTGINYYNDKESIRRSYSTAVGSTIDSASSKALYEFCSKPEILMQLFHTDEDLELVSISVDAYAGELYNSYNVGESDFAKFYEALLTDVKEGNWNPLDKTLSGKDGGIRIDLSYGKWVESNYGVVFREKEWVVINVGSRMEHTLKALEEVTGLSRTEMEELMNWVDPQAKNEPEYYYYY